MREPSERKKRRYHYKEYRERMRQAKEEFDKKHFNSHNEFLNHLQDLEDEYKYLNRKKRRHHEFERYYRSFRIVRPMPIILILILWTLILINSSLSTSLGVILVVFTIIVSLGSVFQILFNYRLERRVLKPIENLKRGMREITKGNYAIEVSAEAHSYIDTLVYDFNAMAKKLKETERLKAEYEENRKDLIANISHDLKTPITSIQGYIEAISDADSLPPEKLEKYLKIIHNNVVYMNRLIDDLFLFSKLDMQKLAFTYTEVSARPFMRDLMEEFRLDLEEQKVSFSYTDHAQQDCKIRIDTKRFHQVLRNIIDNAIKYGPEEGLALQTGLNLDPDAIRITLTDNGPGIPEDKIGLIFNRFYRLDSQRTKDISSTGLGLAIAKELIEMQGGSISAANIPCGGTCFTITLPTIRETQGDK